MKKAAVAIFVKTPGLSPLKTRLARTVGERNAHIFYSLACAAVASVLDQSAQQELTPGTGLSVHPYWAVAEVEGGSRWHGFPTIFQGEGGLGDRLYRVYSELLRQYDAVALIGADCPQLTGQQLREALWWSLEDRGFVMGPARDGGFYVLAGSRPVRARDFASVAYSREDTGAALCRVLSRQASMRTLAIRSDVDEASDLMDLIRELSMLEQPTTEQQELLAWVQKLTTSGLF